VTSDILEEMSCPYWIPPCHSLAAPQSYITFPLLLSFLTPWANKLPSGKRGDAKDNAHWTLGWISTPLPQEPSSSPRVHNHNCWRLRDAGEVELLWQHPWYFPQS